MDWQALALSIKLSLVTLLFLLPIGIFLGRWLAYRQFFGKSLLQTLLALPLVLPPTVLGFYLLVIFSPNQGLGLWLLNNFDITLVFNFNGLVLASIIFNLPFAIQPIQRAFVAIPRDVREAAACCGMSPIRVLWKIELPLAWPGIISAMVMSFAHTLDEPFSAVDQVTRRKLYRELLALRQSLAIPAILVTHDLEESTLLADRIALLHKGQVLQTGSPKFVSSHPNSATIARLMDQQNLFTAVVVNHNKQAQKTYLSWRGIILESRYQPQFVINKRVCWMIQSENVLLHRQDRPSNGDKENPLAGQVVEYFEINGLANLIVEIDCDLKINITMNVPLHVAKRNRLGLKKNIGISLLAEGIHLMPNQVLRHEL